MLRGTLFGMLGGTLFLLLCACHKPEPLQPFEPQTGKDYGRPLPPGALALRKISPEDYPDFSGGFDNQAGLREAIAESLAYMAKPSSQRYFPYGDISHDRAVASLERFRQLLDEVHSGAELDAAVRSEFDVYQSVGCDDCGTVYFTGYYCPIFDGRKQPDARFRYPLYRLPPDLVKNEEGVTLGRRLRDGRLVPYPTRRQLEGHHLLKGGELAWFKDPFEVYVASVQGSAKLKLEDGTTWQLAYAGNNGYDYTPVSRKMIEDGVIGRNEVSLQNLLRYFAQHPEDVQRYTWENDRFIFFRESPGEPVGSINAVITPYRTLATDKAVFPRACLAFVNCKLPRVYEGELTQMPFRAFALDQDTGGAIRAAGKCDVYMGVGPRAEAIAGRTGAEGQLYYIFVRQGGPETID
ncbi:MAG: MltA domain-containing protein [Phycisphaerae bacterium]|jgi:membrane-bound lytic murein transglycosylase A